MCETRFGSFSPHRLTVPDDEAVEVAHGVILHVQVQQVELHRGVWRADQPGALLVREVVLRPAGGEEEARSLPRHQHTSTGT